MVSKRRLMVLGPAVLSLGLLSAGVAQASAAQPSLARPVVASGAVTTAGPDLLPRDEKDEADYNRGYAAGHASGRTACLASLHSQEMPSVAGVSEFYKSGVRQGFSDGLAVCEANKKAPEEEPGESPGEESGKITPPGSEEEKPGHSPESEQSQTSEKPGKASHTSGEAGEISHERITTGGISQESLQKPMTEEAGDRIAEQPGE
ncbi:hypothetical protein Skr01_26910 [Sphaerisporangium krabiense]|uniref:Secreted protein n=1 Tax=Sphaerisporangium krabiense TaxID=763782 RepID=A0A7W9DTA9_9ACTN|nr:hypothetical protein [Sphaerisporangium krabiense]MBB5630441.1 hypothetical protein [Sphaerisporangium krabiense]GII62606.1 hypothetical protein Skr01_26910 [Sphaerisporangium krabiense]